MLGKNRGTSDEAALEDLLSVSQHVRGLAHFVSTCETPMTVAIQGDWGTGKTTMLNLLAKSLKGGPDAAGREAKGPVMVHFDAWQAAFAADDSATFTALVAAIVHGLQNGAPESVEGKLSKSATQFKAALLHWLPRSTNASGLLETAGNMAFPAGGTIAKEVLAAFIEMQSDDLPAVMGGALVRSAFHDLVRDRFGASRSKNSNNRLIVFVDNLDRLRPARAVEVMECLKAVLDSEHCVFVVAIDFDVVLQGLDAKYPEMDRDKARAFFDKIIQLPFQVPVNSYKLDGLIKGLFPAVDAPEGESTLETIFDIINASVGNNPRAIKRLANSYRLLGFIQGARGEGVDTGRLAQIAMQVAYPDVHRYLDSNLDEASEPLSRIVGRSLTQPEETTTARITAEEWMTAAMPALSDDARRTMSPAALTSVDRHREATTSGLEKLIEVIADVFSQPLNDVGSDDSSPAGSRVFDEDAFAETWTLTSVTSREADPQLAVRSGLSFEEVEAHLRAHSAPQEMIQAIKDLMGDWAPEFEKRKGRPHATKTDDGIRVNLNLQQRGRPRKMIEFSFPDQMPPRVAIFGWSLIEGKGAHEKRFHDLARRLHCDPSFDAYHDAYMISGVEASHVVTIGNEVLALLSKKLM